MTDPETHDATEPIGAASATPSVAPRTPNPTRRTRVIGVAVTMLIAVLIATSAVLWTQSRRLDDQVTGMRHQVTVMRHGVTTFKKCVNVYMHTIGQWSTDVNAQYNYRYC